MLFEPKFDVTFITSDETEPKNCHLACGFLTRTDILFKEEQIAAVIECTGEIEFRRPNDMRNTIAAITVPKQEGGREIYMDVTCSVKDGQIVLKMPIYSWIDHYPNCDGESDVSSQVKCTLFRHKIHSFCSSADNRLMMF